MRISLIAAPSIDRRFILQNLVSGVTGVTQSPLTIRVISFLRSGVIAGMLASLSFALIHAVFISSIWFSVVPMMAAGALCGLCIAWSFAVVVSRPSLASWLCYNALLVAMLALLGLTSVLVFRPVTTIPALFRLDGPPTELFRQALPMTFGFAIAASIILCLLYRRGWRGFGAIVLANTVLIALLGLNVSIIGLVDIPRSALYLIAELFGLILSIGSVYAVLVAVLEWKSLVRPSHT